MKYRVSLSVTVEADSAEQAEDLARQSVLAKSPANGPIFYGYGDIRCEDVTIKPSMSKDMTACLVASLNRGNVFLISVTPSDFEKDPSNTDPDYDPLTEAELIAMCGHESDVSYQDRMAALAKESLKLLSQYGGGTLLTDLLPG